MLKYFVERDFQAEVVVVDTEVVVEDVAVDAVEEEAVLVTEMIDEVGHTSVDCDHYYIVHGNYLCVSYLIVDRY